MQNVLKVLHISYVLVPLKSPKFSTLFPMSPILMYSIVVFRITMVLNIPYVVYQDCCSKFKTWKKISPKH